MIDIGLARRYQWWLLALLFHSFTMVMIVVKEFITLRHSGSINMYFLHLASLLARFLGPIFILISSIILLARLANHYPITQVWIS